MRPSSWNRRGNASRFSRSSNRVQQSELQTGDKVQGTFGWQEYAISNGQGILNATVIPEGQSLTAPLSVFGITGLTAYFGLLDVGKAKEGETVLVSGAAGSTGSIAAQIAKLKGCRTELQVELRNVAGSLKQLRLMLLIISR